MEGHQEQYFHLHQRRHHDSSLPLLPPQNPSNLFPSASTSMNPPPLPEPHHHQQVQLPDIDWISLLSGHHDHQINNNKPAAMVEVNNYENNNVIEAAQGEKDSNKRKGAEGRKISVMKKASRPRFAFQTRSADDIIDDGYRWRKYAQKAVKNSLYPSLFID